METRHFNGGLRLWTIVYTSNLNHVMWERILNSTSLFKCQTCNCISYAIYLKLRFIPQFKMLCPFINGKQYLKAKGIAKENGISRKIVNNSKHFTCKIYQKCKIITYKYCLMNIIPLNSLLTLLKTLKQIHENSVSFCASVSIGN